MMEGFFLVYFITSFCIFSNVHCQEICSRKCEASYPLHTIDKVEELQACTKGCRFEMISFLSHKEQLCSVDCNTAYIKGTDGQKKACISGCEEEKRLNQQPKKLEIEVKETNDIIFHFRILRPFFFARNHYYRWFNKQGETLEGPSYSVEQSSTDGQGNSLFMRVEMYPNVNDREFDERQLQKLTIVQEDKEQEASLIKEYAHKMHGTATKWLNCVEVKAGVPYATLVTVLFLSLIMVAWICCSSCDDAVEDLNEKRHTFSKSATSIMADELQMEEKDGVKVYTISSSNEKVTGGQFKVFKPRVIGFNN